MERRNARRDGKGSSRSSRSRSNRSSGSIGSADITGSSAADDERRWKAELYQSVSDDDVEGCEDLLSPRLDLINTRLFDVCFTAVSGESTHLRFKDSSTALHVAAWCGAVRCAKWLLSHGASPDVMDGLNQRPVEIAQPSVLKLLRGTTDFVGVNDKVDTLHEGVKLGMEELRGDVAVSVGQLAAQLSEIRPVLEETARAAARSEVLELRGVVARKLAQELKRVRDDISMLARRREPPLPPPPPPAAVAVASKPGSGHQLGAATGPILARLAKLEEEVKAEMDSVEKLQNQPHIAHSASGMKALVVPQSLHHGDEELKKKLAELTSELEDGRKIIKANGKNMDELERLADLFKDDSLVRQLKRLVKEEGQMEILVGTMKGRVAAELEVLRHDLEHAKESMQDIEHGDGLRYEVDAVGDLQQNEPPRIVKAGGPGGKGNKLYISLASVPEKAVRDALLRERSGNGNEIKVSGDATQNGAAVAALTKALGSTDEAKQAVEDQGQVELRGNRFDHVLDGGATFEAFRAWAETEVGLELEFAAAPPNNDPPEIGPPTICAAFVEAIAGCYEAMHVDGPTRVFHGHGHTCQEIYDLRQGVVGRVPDAVVYPGCHDHVVKIVAAAVEHNVCLIPFGGGTSVSGALQCPAEERRMIVSLDMQHMSRIRWVNRRDMTACVEAGAVGVELEKRLAAQGLRLGHEPDSAEFSTVGGWVATRASGMKKNKYGNIEDIVVDVTIVTPAGTMRRGCLVPRISAGPDVTQLALGSEGTLGVVTEVVLRLRPLAPVCVYGSVIFPDFRSGVAFMHEIAQQQLAPAAIRLVDNMQFQFGRALKPQSTSPIRTAVTDYVQKLYVTKLKGFEPREMTAATVVFEGEAAEVKQQEKAIYAIAAKHGGLRGGEQNGSRGYFLTYMIAYIRDFGLAYNFLAESFETSVPWDNVLILCHEVRKHQVYDTGACVYFYFGIINRGLADPVATFEAIESGAREEVIAQGGSISHHHGVGKHRKKWLPETISDTGMHILKAVKTAVDPSNVFGAGNLLP
eukprot:g2420.t1